MAFKYGANKQLKKGQLIPDVLEGVDLSQFESDEDFLSWLQGQSDQLPDYIRNNPRLYAKWANTTANRYKPGLGDTGPLTRALKRGIDYEFPEEELGRRMNILGQQLTAAEQRQMRTFQESFAGRTGGRMSSARGAAEIGGQAALARSVGQAQIMQQAFNQELQVRQNALQAYIQKYGIDKQAETAMKQLQAQQESAEAAMWGDIAGSLIMLPFLFSGGGDASSDTVTELFDFDASGADMYRGYA